MKTRKLEIRCPLCGSVDVSYSCAPHCCFNHVCAECYATFEPVTTLAGGKVRGATPPDPLPDPADPAVACASCDSVAVYMAEDGLVCTGCGARLVLELTEVTPG